MYAHVNREPKEAIQPEPSKEFSQPTGFGSRWGTADRFGLGGGAIQVFYIGFGTPRSSFCVRKLHVHIYNFYNYVTITVLLKKYLIITIVSYNVVLLLEADCSC